MQLKLSAILEIRILGFLNKKAIYYWFQLEL